VCRSRGKRPHDSRALEYDERSERVNELTDPEAELGEWLQNDPRHSEEIAGIMHQLGIRPRVRL
jgi:hypothetical protein